MLKNTDIWGSSAFPAEIKWSLVIQSANSLLVFVVAMMLTVCWCPVLLPDWCHCAAAPPMRRRPRPMWLTSKTSSIWNTTVSLRWGLFLFLLELYPLLYSLASGVRTLPAWTASSPLFPCLWLRHFVWYSQVLTEGTCRKVELFWGVAVCRMSGVRNFNHISPLTLYLR